MAQMWEEQQSSAANASGDWDNTEETQQTYLNVIDCLVPTLGWPGNSMATLVSSNVASVSNALDGYAVLDSACSHRSVFNSMLAFPTGVSTDSNVVMVDSNGTRKAAPGIGAASVTAFPLLSSPIDDIFMRLYTTPRVLLIPSVCLIFLRIKTARRKTTILVSSA